MKTVILKHGKDRPIRNFHHWIFSGAIESMPPYEDGEILAVTSAQHMFLGYAYFNSLTSIAGRMVSFSQRKPLAAIEQNIIAAVEFRKAIFKDSGTNSFRLINGEGDNIPGLTIDLYKDVLVMQVSTLGIEKIKDKIVEFLIKHVNPRIIYEKSEMPARRHEGLDSFSGFLYGEEDPIVTITENGHLFEIDLEKSHKTGFYLDQREMRTLIGNLAKDRRVLNCFSYTGGFSIYAAKQGAKVVDSLDISKEVIEQAKRNFLLNDLDPEKHGFIVQDIFEFIEKDELNYDIVILDPPAFAKKKEDFGNAFRAYKKLNKKAIQRMPSGSFLLTCSCSYNMQENEFLRAITEASEETGRKIRIIQKHRHAMDHPQNIYHHEMDYLKSFLLYIQ